MVTFADGLTGIKKAIIDWYIAAARAGAICPPVVLGVGIGGTADIAAHLAKVGAVLRLVGSRHPEPDMAKIEQDLTTAINSLGIGSMGSGGKTSVFAVNVEYSLTHIAGAAVAMSANCGIARRATTKLYADGRTEEIDDPDWFDRR
jgi:tartrate/fumarate subfamily iron-sulfur-dependent hydro-lyase alpha chain